MDCYTEENKVIYLEYVDHIVGLADDFEKR